MKDIKTKGSNDTNEEVTVQRRIYGGGVSVTETTPRARAPRSRISKTSDETAPTTKKKPGVKK